MGNKVSMLYIEAVTSYHAGNYTCIATNQAGRANYTAALKVHGEVTTDLTDETLFWMCLLLVEFCSILFLPWF